MHSNYKKTWIVIADGAHARIFLNDGLSAKLTPVLDQPLMGTRQTSQEIGSDRPGVSFSSAGPGRSAMTPRTDPHQHAENEFVKLVAKTITEGLNAQAFDHLILVAPPKALGVLRKELDPQAAKRIKSELHKDLTHLTQHQLSEYLAETLKA